ncbi:putative membrane protein [Lachnospiraceae bacterium PF1-22]
MQKLMEVIFIILVIAILLVSALQYVNDIWRYPMCF